MCEVIQGYACGICLQMTRCVVIHRKPTDQHTLKSQLKVISILTVALEWFVVSCMEEGQRFDKDDEI